MGGVNEVTATDNLKRLFSREGSFTQSSLLFSDLLMALEPKTRKCLEINNRNFWFMGSPQSRKGWVDLNMRYEVWKLATLATLFMKNNLRKTTGNKIGNKVATT